MRGFVEGGGLGGAPRYAAPMAKGAWRRLAEGLLVALALLCLWPSQGLARLRVTATFLPVYIFALNVGGDRAQVSLLVPPGMDVHEFSMRPGDIRKLHDADLVVVSGAGLDDFVAARISGKRLVNASSGVDLIMKGEAPDPHVWLDPLRAARQVENIRDAFSRLDPENARYYESRAARYAERLRALDAEIREGLRGLRSRHLVTYHDSFSYFAERYGLEAHPLAGPEAEYPLPGRMREVYDIVRRHGLKGVFAEAQFPAEALESLRRDLAVRVCTLDTMEAGEPEEGYYEEAMRRNLRSIVQCLGTD
ncbi:MAG: metal ABC transporter substrate-binding protein [Thermodesulfovibrionales bacterium]